ncbi:MAG: ABC transporter permease [Anaerolineae bacterium]|nr:ABC transporter permease [Anaerolineae bacterium]
MVKEAQMTPAYSNFTDRIKSFFLARETGVLVALIVMAVFLSFATPAFLSVRNLLNVGRQVSLLGIMSVGMTYVLISREVDLSVGSIYALVGLITGMLIVSGWGLIAALVIGLLIGALVGFINGWLSTYGALPSFITTLGMMSVARGVALLITNGEPVTVNEAQGADPQTLTQFYYLGQGRIFDLIPMQLIFFVIVAILGWILLSKTVFGFKIYAVGGSDKAARVSGIKVYNVKIWAFIIMGFLSGLAGILSLAFLPSGQAGRTGVGLELDVIAATIVGGASLAGGEGTILGTILGVLIIGVLRNGLILMGISAFWQETMIGAVIILAVGIDKWTRSRRGL